MTAKGARRNAQETLRASRLQLSFSPGEPIRACSRLDHLFYLPVFQVDHVDLSVWVQETVQATALKVLLDEAGTEVNVELYQW